MQICIFSFKIWYKTNNDCICLIISFWNTLLLVIWIDSGLWVIWYIHLTYGWRNWKSKDLLSLPFVKTHSVTSDHSEVYKYTNKFPNAFCLWFYGCCKVLNLFSFRIDTIPTFVRFLTFSVHKHQKSRKSINHISYI